MSIEASNSVWEHSRTKGIARLVALAIADHTNNEQGGIAWPGLKRLMKYCNCSRRAVQRAIQSMEELGELEVLERGSGSTSSRYKLTLPTPTRNKGRQIDITSSETLTPGRRTIDTPGGGETTPNPLSSSPNISPSTSLTTSREKVKEMMGEDTMKALIAWNALARNYDLPECVEPTQCTIKRLNALIEWIGLGKWKQALARYPMMFSLLGQLTMASKQDWSG